MTPRRAALPLFVVLASCGGAALAPEPPRPAAPPAPPALPAAAEPAASAQATAVASTSKPPPPAEEAIPATLGTPADSRAAAPRWWTEREQGYAPAPGFAQTLFEAAGKPGGADDPAALACTVSVGSFRESTYFTRSQAKADLIVRVRLGKGPRQALFETFNGWDDNEATFVVPLAVLQPGDPLSVQLDDANVLSPDSLDHVGTTFLGHYPLPLRGRLAKGECRPVGRALIERQALKARADADRAIAAFRASKLWVSSSSLGTDGDHGAGQARGVLEALAGLVGFADPRVARRVQALSDAEAEHTRALGAEVAEALTRVPGGTGTLATGMLEVTADPVECGPEVVKRLGRFAPSRAAGAGFRQSQCAVTLHLQNRSPEAVELGVLTGSLGPIESLVALTPAGARFRVHPVAEVGPKGPRALPTSRPKKLAAHAGITLVALLSDEARSGAPTTPMLLRAVSSRATAAVGADAWTTFGGDVDVRATALACDDAAQTRFAAVRGSVSWVHGPVCVLDVEVRNTGAAPARLFLSGPPWSAVTRLDLLGARGLHLNLDAVALGEGPREEVAPGATRAMTFVAERGKRTGAGRPLGELWFAASFSPRVEFLRLD